MKSASSQASWALLASEVTAARVCTHRLHALLQRALDLVDESTKKEEIYSAAGDLIMGVPKNISDLENALDKASYTISKMGITFLDGRIPLEDKAEIEEASTAISVRKAARRYLDAHR